VFEETGIEARIQGLTGIYGRRDGSVAIVFTAQVADDAEPAGPRHEISEQRWVRLEKAMTVLPRKTRRRLADALRAAPGRRAAALPPSLRRLAARG
jgi:ADP-ribose pyrophosphatase YjhB (NUDIX family)